MIRLIKNFSNFCNIAKYYGNFIEVRTLLKSLWSPTKESWESNKRAYLNLFLEDNYSILLNLKTFESKAIEFLLKDELYRVSIIIFDEKLRKEKNFLKNVLELIQSATHIKCSNIRPILLKSEEMEDEESYNQIYRELRKKEGGEFPLSTFYMHHPFIKTNFLHLDTISVLKLPECKDLIEVKSLFFPDSLEGLPQSFSQNELIARNLEVETKTLQNPIFEEKIEEIKLKREKVIELSFFDSNLQRSFYEPLEKALKMFPNLKKIRFKEEEFSLNSTCFSRVQLPITYSFNINYNANFELVFEDAYIYFINKKVIKALKVKTIKSLNNFVFIGVSKNNKALIFQTEDSSLIWGKKMIGLEVIGPAFIPNPEKLKFMDKNTLQQLEWDKIFVIENKNLHCKKILLPEWKEIFKKSNIWKIDYMCLSYNSSKWLKKDEWLYKKAKEIKAREKVFKIMFEFVETDDFDTLMGLIILNNPSRIVLSTYSKKETLKTFIEKYNKIESFSKKLIESRDWMYADVILKSKIYRSNFYFINIPPILEKN